MASRLVAVLGTPCGATDFISTSFQGVRLGGDKMDVRHEHVGKHGTSCGFMAWGQQANGQRRFRQFEWTYIVRLIRHPLDVAETLPALVEDGTLPNPHIWAHPEDPQLSALRYWVETHEIIDGLNPDATLCVGPNLNDDWTALLKMIGADSIEPPQGIRTRRGGKRWDRMSEDEWCERDPEYARRGAMLWGRFV